LAWAAEHDLHACHFHHAMRPPRVLASNGFGLVTTFFFPFTLPIHGDL